MKTYVIRAERKTIGYYHIKTKSLEEVIVRREPMLVEPYNEFIKEKK
jgi:hypothetical protein